MGEEKRNKRKRRRKERRAKREKSRNVRGQREAGKTSKNWTCGGGGVVGGEMEIRRRSGGDERHKMQREIDAKRIIQR